MNSHEMKPYSQRSEFLVDSNLISDGMNCVAETIACTFQNFALITQCSLYSLNCSSNFHSNPLFPITITILCDEEYESSDLNEAAFKNVKELL